MEPLPSLAGLSLAPDGEDEALPEPTEAAPLVPGGANRGFAFETDKYDEYRFKTRLRSWKDRTEVRARWNVFRGRAYVEDDPDFYEDWVQASQQESFFYEYFNSYPPVNGTEVIHPIQHILRVVTEAYVDNRQQPSTPEEMIVNNSICIVDGSNMFDVGYNEYTNQFGQVRVDSRREVVDHWNDVIQRAKRSVTSMPDIAIGFVKAQTLSPAVNGYIANHPGEGVFIDGEDGPERIPPNYKRLYQMLSKVGKWVCLVVVEEWERKTKIRSGGTSACHPDELAGVQYPHIASHDLCEYDDFLMMTLREYIDHVKGACHGNVVRFGNGRLVQEMQRTDTNEEQKKTWYDEWRTEPALGVVTFDKQMWRNATTEKILNTFAAFLSLSDVFRMRVFLPTATTPNQSLAQSLRGLLRRYHERYNHRSDYAQDVSKQPFYSTAYTMLDQIRRLSAFNSAREQLNEYRRVTWEYSTRKDNPCPPGWPLRRPSTPSNDARLQELRRVLAPHDAAIMQQLIDAEGVWHDGVAPGMPP